MFIPDRIHINWNAADNYEHLVVVAEDVGFLANGPTPEQILAALALQKGQMFRLPGWITDPAGEVLLSIVDGEDVGVHFKNRIEPLFDGVYTTANDPAPILTLDGDVLFDLIVVP